MSDLDMQRFLGAIEARTTMLEKRMDVVERDIKSQLSGIQNSIAALRTSMDSSRGAWRAIAWFSGLLVGAAAVVSILSQFGALHVH